MDERKLSIAIKIGILMASAYMSSGIVVQSLRGHLPAIVTSTLPENAPAFKAGKQFGFDYYRPVWEKNFFNPDNISVKDEKIPAKMEKITEELEHDENLPLSSLNYKLIGTVTGPPEKSYAIIDVPGKKEQILYHQGDSIGDVKIIKIKRTRLILNNKGREEVLEMKFDTALTGRAAIEVTGKPLREAEGIIRVSANSFILDKKEAERLSGNVTQFMTQVRVVPNIVRGKSSGYKLLNIKKGSLIQNIGLKNGDIVKEINGKSINKPEEAFQAYQQLKNGGSFVLDIERGGKKETIHYEVR